MFARHGNGNWRIKIGLGIALFGFFTYVIGADPGLFGIDRSPIIGLIQILVFMIGLAIMCVGGHISFASMWNGYVKPISADIGMRLVWTGYVIAAASAFADIFGFGSHLYPHIPYFGNLQATGVLVGEFVIAFGFLLMIPFRQRQENP
jgi:hypothetical protein